MILGLNGTYTIRYGTVTKLYGTLLYGKQEIGLWSTVHGIFPERGNANLRGTAPRTKYHGFTAVFYRVNCTAESPGKCGWSADATLEDHCTSVVF